MKTSTKNTLITAGVSLIVGILGVLGGIKLNINQTITIIQDGKATTVNSSDFQNRNNELAQETLPLESNQILDNESNNNSTKKLEAINKSNYLLELVTPYESPYWFTEYNGKTFDMGGDSYTHGFTCMGYGSENEGNTIVFNLHGNYSKMSFIVGVVNRAGIFNDSDDNCTITIFADNIVVDTIIINPNNLPSEHEVNINNCKQLKICVYDGNYVADGSGTYGFGEVKIYE